MSSDVLCDTCGSAIDDADFESGAAITLLGKQYCPGCKAAAVDTVHLDDLARKPAPPATRARKPPAPAAPKTPAQAQAPAKPPPMPASEAPTVVRRPASRSRRLARSAVSRGPLVAGLAAGVILLLGIAAFLLFRKPATEGASASSAPAPPPTPGPADPESRARQAFAAVETAALRPDASPDAVLSAVDKARASCKGTPFEARLDKIEARARQARESQEALKALNPLIDDLRSAVAGDAPFKRYVELQEKFRAARDLAARGAVERLGDIQRLQADYTARYEAAAEPFYREASEAASQLADENRWDDALKHIDSFPAQYRQTAFWKGLERLKQDIERRRKKK